MSKAKPKKKLTTKTPEPSTAEPVVTPATKAELPSGWRLLRQALSDYRRHLWRYLWMVGVVAVPIGLFGLVPALTSDSSVSFYLNLASLFMTAALLWAVTRAQDQLELKQRQAYYEGSALVLRLLVVAALLALMIIPAAIGLSLYSLGTNPSDGSVTWQVQLLLGGLAIVLFIPTLYWLTRFGLAIFRVGESDDWPLTAMKTARLVTLGRFWPTAGRLILLIVWVLLLMVVPAVVFVLLTVVTRLTLFLTLLQISFSLLALPLVMLYGYRLYRALLET